MTKNELTQEIYKVIATTLREQFDDGKLQSENDGIYCDSEKLETFESTLDAEIRKFERVGGLL